MSTTFYFTEGSQFHNDLHTSKSKVPAENCNKYLQNINQALANLQSNILDLQNHRSTALINIMQYHNDLESMALVHKRMRDNLDNQLKQNKLLMEEMEKNSQKQQLTVDIERSIIYMRNFPWKCESSLYDQSKVKLKYAIHTRALIYTTQFNKDGSMFAFSDFENIFIISTHDGNIIGNIKLSNDDGKNVEIKVIKFSDDNKLIAYAMPNNAIAIYSLITRKILKTLTKHTAEITSLYFLKDKQQLISAGFDGLLCFWSMTTFEIKQAIQHGNPTVNNDANDFIVAVDTTANDELLLLFFMGGKIGIYQLSNMVYNHISYIDNSNRILDGKGSKIMPGFVTASQDGTIKTWKISDQIINDKIFMGHEDIATTASYTYDSKLIISGSKDKSIKFWNTQNGQTVFTIKAHQNTVFDICTHPSSKIFISSSADGVIALWEYSIQID